MVWPQQAKFVGKCAETPFPTTTPLVGNSGQGVFIIGVVGTWSVGKGGLQEQFPLHCLRSYVEGGALIFEPQGFQTQIIQGVHVWGVCCCPSMLGLERDHTLTQSSPPPRGGWG